MNKTYGPYACQSQGMTPAQVRKFYKDQLESFYKLGIGNKTRHGVVVTDVLIEVTKRRLSQLSINVNLEDDDA